eukprot:327347-Chlamydomonas_euryale.AAC.6
MAAVIAVLTFVRQGGGGCRGAGMRPFVACLHALTTVTLAVSLQPQAMPGPLFNFAAYLGAIIATNAGVNVFLGALVAWFGLFSPGVTLMFACLPFWARFRSWQIYRRALPGAWT